jgi:hypothetical protein
MRRCSRCAQRHWAYACESLEFTDSCARCHQSIWRTTHGVWLTTIMAESVVCYRGMDPTGRHDLVLGHEPEAG